MTRLQVGPAGHRPVVGPAMARSLLGAAVAGGAGLAVAVFAGRMLPLPGAWSVAAWERWWTSVGPLIGVFALARVVLVIGAAALALAFGVVAAAVAVAAADRRGRGGGGVLSAGRWPAVGPLLRLAVAASAAGAALAGCGSASIVSGRGSPPAAPTLTNLAAPGPGATAGSPEALASGSPRSPAAVSPPGAAPPAPSPGAAVPVPAVAPPASGAGPSAPGVPPASGEGLSAPGVPPDQSPPAPDRSPPAPGRWVVRPGDSLWSIAEATVGSPPARVAAYWVDLVKLNRPTLPDPADPSLLFPGDVVVLPPLQATGR